MLFALGFITMFMIGGFTGIMHSSVPIDAQHQDTYFVVAHFHYVLIGGALFGLFAGFYFLDSEDNREALVRKSFRLHPDVHRFQPYVFPCIIGIDRSNLVGHTATTKDMVRSVESIATVGSFILGVGVLIGVLQFIHSFYSKKLKPAGKNPWDARSLEWTLSSPVKDYNFARTPIIKARDQAWENNYGSKDKHSEKEPLDDHGVHMPDRSWTPLITGFGHSLCCSVCFFINPLACRVNWSGLHRCHSRRIHFCSRSHIMGHRGSEELPFVSQGRREDFVLRKLYKFLKSMSEAATHALEHHEPVTSTGIPNKKILMWTFLGSDCMFFGTLISTHLIYRKISGTVNGTPLDIRNIFDIELTSFSTFILFASSLFMALAVSAIHKGNLKSTRWMLLGTIVFGAIF